MASAYPADLSRLVKLTVPPQDYATKFHPRRDLALRYADGSAPDPPLTLSIRATRTAGANSQLDRN
jgi:hypothetical protein